MENYFITYLFGLLFGVIICFSFWYMEMEEKGYIYGIGWTIIMLIVGYLLFILASTVTGLV